ncbi:MAG: DUF6525 family protein [Pseudomonadota bacterium]
MAGAATLRLASPITADRGHRHHAPCDGRRPALRTDGRLRVAGNLGHTRLRKRRRCENPMQEFDRLPPELRAWLSHAALPWRPRSVQRAFDKAMARTGDAADALAELSRLEAQQLARDTTAWRAQTERECG